MHRAVSLRRLSTGSGSGSSRAGWEECLGSRPSQPLHVLVTGGSGFIGSHLRRALAERGHAVTVLSRTSKAHTTSSSSSSSSTSSEDEQWADLASIRRAGLPSHPRLSRLPDALVQLAGKPLAPYAYWSAAIKRDIYQSRIATLRDVQRALFHNRHTLKSLVVASAVGIYPLDQPDVTFTEDSQVDIAEAASGDVTSAPNFPQLLVRDLESEALLFQRERLAKRVANLRLGVVMGHDGGALQRMLAPFSMVGGVVLGSGKQPMPWIHVDDIVTMFIWAIENDSISGTLNGVAPQIISNAHFTEEVTRALGRTRTHRMPEWPMRFLLREQGQLLLDGSRVWPQRTIDLGFRYQYPSFREAAEAVAQAYQQRST